MDIASDRCIGCGQCVDYCPSGAISLVEAVATIDPVLCVECGTCRRVQCCPVDAILESSLGGTPRAIRAFFSDPAATHAETGIPGRGTEEVKTNDVTGRVRPGWVGIGIEVGRPCLGTMLAEVEKITTALAPLGIRYERNNPMTYLLESQETGRIKEEYRGERVTSLIIEFTVEEGRLAEVLGVLRDVSGRLDTVFALDVIACFDERGELPVWDSLVEMGYRPRPNAKVNLGLGRPAASALVELVASEVSGR
ncbi:MAG: 4Fe-4S binding protein [Bacillota bacterium]